MNRCFVRCGILLLAIFLGLNAAVGADTLQRIQQAGVLKWGADAEGGGASYSQQTITRQDNASLTNLRSLKGKAVETLSGTVACE